jgi:hypothetical protein
MPPQRRRYSSVVEAHQIFERYHREHEEDITVDNAATNHGGRGHKPVPSFPMFHRVQKTGVIYATSRASSKGFSPDKQDWANMGQGAPETGPIAGAPPRDFSMTIPDAELEYAPVTGLPELRNKVAHYYNFLYRQGKESQYSAENVCIVPGGRAGISRIMVRFITVVIISLF